GDISVTSKPGKGTMFTITLPQGTAHLNKSEITLASAEKKLYYDERIFETETVNTETENTETGDKADTTILVIEDNDDMRNYITQNLSENFHVIETDNGITGIQLAFENIPDLIIS